MADLDVRPVPATWCAQCGYDQHGAPVLADNPCWTLPQPLTAHGAARQAYGAAVVSLVGDGPPSDASPEVLDLLVRELQILARRIRRERAR